jgi:riboflavin biosynthesis pyrimidine reductase
VRILLGGEGVRVGDPQDLTDDDLAALYALAPGRSVRANMVSTVDGAGTGPDGLSGGINDDADGRVFATVRRLCDAVVVGAGTARDEGYGPADVPVVLVSRRGQVPEKLQGHAPGRVLLATCVSAEGLGEARSVLGDDHVLVLGDDEVDLAALPAELGARGMHSLLSEGGPGLLGDLLAAGVVDELCWTVVPRLTGGDAVRMVTGAEVDVALRPALLLEQDGTLLGRWLVE